MSKFMTEHQVNRLPNVLMANEPFADLIDFAFVTSLEKHQILAHCTDTKFVGYSSYRAETIQRLKAYSVRTGIKLTGPVFPFSELVRFLTTAPADVPYALAVTLARRACMRTANRNVKYKRTQLANIAHQAVTRFKFPVSSGEVA